MKEKNTKNKELKQHIIDTIFQLTKLLEYLNKIELQEQPNKNTSQKKQNTNIEEENHNTTHTSAFNTSNIPNTLNMPHIPYIPDIQAELIENYIKNSPFSVDTYLNLNFLIDIINSFINNLYNYIVNLFVKNNNIPYEDKETAVKAINIITNYITQTTNAVDEFITTSIKKN